ncbi:MAG TPA: lipocalin family protein [Rectinemataceae bacterium]|nr:lipocalin family protein [Rectinemataceae bacterium]
MKRAALSITAIAIAIALAGCAQATSPSTGAANYNPTIAALVGTWLLSATSSTSASSTSSTETMTIASDGSFQGYVTRTNTPSGGTASTSYSAMKGTLSFSGDQMTYTVTGTENSSSLINSTNVSWTTFPSPLVTTNTAILDNGKLYGLTGGSVLTAQGTVSGLVGTWGYSSYNSADTSPYTKVALTLNADGTATSEMYQSTTSTFSSTPTSTASGTWSASNGVLTLTQSSQIQSLAYSSIGNYLIWGNATNADAYAFAKQ